MNPGQSRVSALGTRQGLTSARKRGQAWQEGAGLAAQQKTGEPAGRHTVGPALRTREPEPTPPWAA